MRQNNSRLRVIAATVLTTAATCLGVLTAPTASAATAGVLGADHPAAIEGSYIVVFKDTAARSASATAASLASRYGATVEDRYTAALQGFHGRMSEAAAARLAADPAVKLVQQDMYAENVLLGTQSPTPSWGLDRVDQRNLPLNNTYNYPDRGSNVRVYVVDTGVRISHSDFGGRASYGRDTIDNDNVASDCQGHGTHVAGTAAGSRYGVAKTARIVGVRMINCFGGGPVSAAVAAVDWVTANAVRPAVANASWGYPPSLDPGGTIAAAVRRSLASGVVWAFAAGNENSTTCTRTPQDRVSELLLAMAGTRTDTRASFSNHGRCGDIFAPGQDIVSAGYRSDTGTATMSGTSMASPHIAGAEALYLASNPTATDAQVQSALFTAATPNKITGTATGTPNRLLFVQ